MICGFMGTVIGVERAVAVKLRAAWLAPWHLALGPCACWSIRRRRRRAVACRCRVLHRRQRCRCASSAGRAHPAAARGGFGVVDWLRAVLRRPGDAASLPWWFAFLVMTIAAERLEMTRLMRRRPGANASLWLLLGLMALGAALTSFSVRIGGVLYGLSLLLLALWLGVLTSHAARCLPTGWPATWPCVCSGATPGLRLLAGPGRALRSVCPCETWPACTRAGLHCEHDAGARPVILPAIARIKIEFGKFFWCRPGGLAPVTDRAPGLGSG